MIKSSIVPVNDNIAAQVSGPSSYPIKWKWVNILGLLVVGTMHQKLSYLSNAGSNIFGLGWKIEATRMPDRLKCFKGHLGSRSKILKRITFRDAGLGCVFVTLSSGIPINTERNLGLIINGQGQVIRSTYRKHGWGIKPIDRPSAKGHLSMWLKVHPSLSFLVSRKFGSHALRLFEIP